MGIGLRAPLDPGEGVVQLLCQRAGLEVVDGIRLALVGQLADGTDDGGGADAHGLLQRSIGGCTEKNAYYKLRGRDRRCPERSV